MCRMLETRRNGGRGINKVGGQQSDSLYGHPYVIQHLVNNLRTTFRITANRQARGGGRKVHINWGYTQNIRGYDVMV